MSCELNRYLCCLAGYSLIFPVAQVRYFWHYIGSRFPTFLSNIFTDLNLGDMEACDTVFANQLMRI
jgi:hypothetical protein